MSDKRSEETADANTGPGVTQARLLTVAAALFRRKGFSASTTRELAAELGIQRASLYHHIDGKEDLLYRLCFESINHLHTEVARAVAMAADPSKRLQALIRTHLRTMLKDRDKHATLLVELRSLGGERGQEILILSEQYEGMVRGVVSEAQASGVIRRDIPSKQLSLALLNLLNWTIFWFDPEGDLSPDDLSQVLGSIYLDGAGSSKRE